MATMSDPFRSFLQTQQEISPQRWKPRQQVWDQLFIQTEMPPGNNSIYPPKLGGLISQPCTLKTESQRGMAGWRGAGPGHRAPVLPPEADTSLIAAFLTTRRALTLCEAQPKVLLSHPAAAVGPGHGCPLPSTRLGSPQHTPGYTNGIAHVPRPSLPPAHAEDTTWSAGEFCSPSPSASHSQHQKIYEPQ